MKLLVVTDLSFPTGSAMASRINSFCLLFKELGYDIHVIAGKCQDNSIEYNKIYKNDIYSYEIVKSNRSEKLQSFIGNENLVECVDSYLNKNNVDLVFFNSLGALFNKILKVCKKHYVKTILEQCEWYDVTNFRFSYLDLRYIRFNNNINNNYKKVDGIICISKLLEDYYKKQGVKTIRIPSIFDVKNSLHSENVNNSKIKLIYSGSVGRSKELLKPILKSLNNKDIKDKIELDIYGLNKEQVLNNIDNENDLLTNNIKVHGRVNYQELQNALLNSNYQIFIKPVRRSSNAQFPTKLAESMSYGTPIITNNTGDITLYVKNGINGFICDTNNIDRTLLNIIKIDNKEYNELRINARKTAIENFDYRNYKESLEIFVKTL